MLLFRLARLYRRVRQRRAVGLLVVVGLLAVSILGNATCFYFFETPGDGQDRYAYADALWYSVISITTIGYGDFSAASLGARLGTVFFIVIVGLAAFSIALGMAIDWFSDLSSKGKRGMSNVIARDHVVIVNFPSPGRVRQLIGELQADPHNQGREIVIVADRIDRLPFEARDVLFVKGPLLEQETYLRASIKQAKMAIVLATDYSDPNSDAVVASAVAVLDGLKPELHIVAECLNQRHRMLFNTVHCDAVVCTLDISGNLLAQEAHDPGVAQLMDTISSNVRGTTLFSTAVESTPDGDVSYSDIAKRLLDRDINLICVNRGEESHTSLSSLTPRAGDRVIYAGSQRRQWPDLFDPGTAAMGEVVEAEHHAVRRR